ncbi:uncharacterized protein LOC116208715 [Punica granatum]|uniref:Senescence regulator S40 n=2 Tax=Punica granatum TaxID=22663 RepID=A0A218XPC2_PUNGR|nr:uncharacterized protein LOC116208715 [Punica granatum]OWM86341.1 hypothetical protein CDL15_Pgr010683 [Punica granatum]PKI56867.1 hypothetical protein CRG98_022754 [Punica granatum]
MAKGRKLTTSRSDRYLDSFSYGSNYGGNGSQATEFGEEDVWSVVDDAGNGAHGHEDTDSSQSEGSLSSAGESSRRMAIPRTNQSRHAGGLSLAFEDPAHASPRILHQFRGNDGASPSSGGGGRSINMASSAPVNVPDWNKIYRVDSVESMHDSDEERDEEMVPPHVYLARSRKMLATSVFEGQGRTLKGRDMSRVRDAVWSRTGFDG